MSDEIQPFVVYRIQGEQMECALWRFQDGRKALAIFLSGDSATTYRDSANLGEDWKIFCPAREALLRMLKVCHEGGIVHAVLDPDLEKARRIFDIRAILDAAGA